MCNNLNNEKKERIKIEDSKRKKRHDNLNNNEKEQLRKYDEKGKTLDERNSIFNNVQMCSMVIHPYSQHQHLDSLKTFSKLLFRKVLLTFVIFVGNPNFEGMLLN